MENKPRLTIELTLEQRHKVKLNAIKERKTIKQFILEWIDKLPLAILLLAVLTTSANAKDSETVIIAKVISAEACSDGLQGLWGVASTVANRARAWNKTPYEVVTQRNAYYGYTAKNRDKIFSNPKCSQASLTLAKNIMRLQDNTDGALYFLKDGEKRRKWHKIKTVKIGKHTFYR